MQKFKYIQNYAIDGEGTINLYDAIGTVVDQDGMLFNGISGSAFAQEMLWLQNNCKVINIRINSVGGSVIDGYSIISSILNSKVPCNTYIDGLAASIAAVIAVAGKKCYMADYGTMMIHNVSGGESKEISELFKNTLVTLLSNRCGKTADEVSAMMDEETWMKPAQCLEMGFVDEIIPSNKKVKIKKTDSIYNIAKVYNSLINKPNMKKIAKILNIAEETATEEVVLLSIEEKDSTIEKLKNENKELADKVAAFEAKEKEAKDAEEVALKADAEALVNKAEAEKKINAEEKESYLAQASKSREDLKFVSNVLSKISNVKTAGTTLTSIPKNESKDVKGERAEWTIRDWEKKDPKGLKEILDSNPELYKEMYDNFYKKSK